MSLEFWIGAGVGAFAVVLVVLVAALCAVASDADDRAERMRDRELRVVRNVDLPIPPRDLA